MRDAAQFRADDIGGKAGAQQAAVERRDLPLVELAADMRKAALEARADRCGFVRFGERRIERSFNMAIGNAPAAKLARDAVTSLAAQLGVPMRIVEGVASIVEIIEFTKASDDRRNQIFILGAPIEILLHLVNRVRTAHQRAQSRCVQLRPGGKLAWSGARTHVRESIAENKGPIPASVGVSDRVNRPPRERVTLVRVSP